MTEDNERWVPSPEEMREAKIEGKQNRSDDADPSDAEEAPRGVRRVIMRLRPGAGQRRREAKAPPVSDEEEPHDPDSPATEEESAVDSGVREAEGSLLIDHPEPPSAEDARMRQDGTRIRRIRPKRDTPAQQPSAPTRVRPVSAEEEAVTRAAERGHKIGVFKGNSLQPRRTARCELCGATLTIVIDVPDNYTEAAATYGIRGSATERDCR